MNFTILQSVYNKDKPEFLWQSLKSIADNTVQPESIILVKDGKLSDALETVITEWKSKLPLKVVGYEQNRGLAYALSYGLKFVETDLVARMDSDDIAMPNRFKIQESYMKQHPDVEILGGSLEEFNDEGTLHKVRTYPQNFTAIKNSIHKASPLGHPTVMFRHSLFKRGYRYSNQFFICEDVVLWFEALAGGIKINNIHDIVLKFRRNDSMMNRRGKKKAWSEFLAYTYGIHMLDGIFTIKYIYPCARLLFRLMPSSIIKFIYNSKLRNVITHA